MFGKVKTATDLLSRVERKVNQTLGALLVVPKGFVIGRRIEWPVVLKSLRQVRVGNVRPAKRDEIGCSTPDRALSEIACVAAATKHNALERLLGVEQVKRRALVLVAEAFTIKQSQVGQLVGAQALYDVREHLDVVGASEVRSVRRETHIIVVNRPHGLDGVDDLDEGASAVFEGAAVRVCAVVSD